LLHLAKLGYLWPVQFTKQVIALISVVVFSTTFLPRHWWHHCHHDHGQHGAWSDIPESETVLSPADCAICAAVIPLFNAPDELVFEDRRVESKSQFKALEVSAHKVDALWNYPGRAPPSGFL
jgi:hypothetical protein